MARSVVVKGQCVRRGGRYADWRGAELPTPAFCSFPSEFPSSDVLSPGLGPVTASPRGPACFVRSSPVMRTSTESRKPVSSAHRKTSFLTASQGVNRGSNRVAVTHERYREDPIEASARSRRPVRCGLVPRGPPPAHAGDENSSPRVQNARVDSTAGDVSLACLRQFSSRAVARAN